MADSGSVPWRAWDGLDGVLYQFTTVSGGYSLLMTNLSQLWTETVDADSFLQRLRALNPALEATAEQALPCLVETVGTRDGGASWSDGLVRLDSRRGGVPLRWEFRLRSLPAAELADRLMRPLLATLAQMQAREQRLLTEVEARDRELQDYRQSGAHLTLRSLRTEPLSRDRFESEMAGRGLRPAQLVDASAWRALPPPAAVKESPVKVTPASPGSRAAEVAAAPVVPPKEDERGAAERRRRELKQRLEDEARRSEMERKNKKKRLNL